MRRQSFRDALCFQPLYLSRLVCATLVLQAIEKDQALIVAADLSAIYLAFPLCRLPGRCRYNPYRHAETPGGIRCGCRDPEPAAIIGLDKERPARAAMEPPRQFPQTVQQGMLSHEARRSRQPYPRDVSWGLHSCEGANDAGRPAKL